MSEREPSSNARRQWIALATIVVVVAAAGLVVVTLPIDAPAVARLSRPDPGELPPPAWRAALQAPQVSEVPQVRPARRLAGATPARVAPPPSLAASTLLDAAARPMVLHDPVVTAADAGVLDPVPVSARIPAHDVLWGATPPAVAPAPVIIPGRSPRRGAVTAAFVTAGTETGRAMRRVGSAFAAAF